MSFEVSELSIPEVKIIRSKKIGDERGFFSETYNKRAFSKAGLAYDFVQDNHSFSEQMGTVRGLHYQSQPFAQDKLVRVVRGRILDVAVDIRKASPTFGKWVTAGISAAEWNQIFVPIGFAHGICTLEPNTELVYKVTNFYSPEHDLGIRWNDPDLAIDWPFQETEMTISEKDRRQPLFKDVIHWIEY